MPKMVLETTINGEETELLVQPYATLLEASPAPSEQEIRLGIAGNLCRCTGYTKMVAAIGEAATELAGKGG